MRDAFSWGTTCTNRYAPIDRVTVYRTRGLRNQQTFIFLQLKRFRTEQRKGYEKYRSVNGLKLSVRERYFGRT